MYAEVNMPVERSAHDVCSEHIRGEFQRKNVRDSRARQQSTVGIGAERQRYSIAWLKYSAI
jgi:hypothetical protein